MPGYPAIESLRDVASDYDAVLCDAWGVIHNGRELMPGAAEAMTNFRREHGPLIILTNAPRPCHIIPPQLDRLGLRREAYDGVVTSGDAVRAEIDKRLPAPAFRIGPEKDDPLFEGLDIRFVDLEAADFLICTGLVDDQSEHPDDYRNLLQEAAVHDLEMVCANPDIVVNWGGRMVWCAGALAEIYKELGGRVVYGGKPHAPIYELAFNAVNEAAGRAIGQNRILAVGDGLGTDILGANRAGVDALLIAGDGGIEAGEDDLEHRLAKAGVDVIGISRGLQW